MSYKTATALAAAVLVAATTVGAAAPRMNCGKRYTDAQASTMIGSSKQRVAMARMALRGYDACMAGDMFSADRFFRMLDMNRGGPA